MLKKNTHYSNGTTRKSYYFDQETNKHCYLRWDGTYFVCSRYIDPVTFSKIDDAEYAGEVRKSHNMYMNKLDQVDRQIAQRGALQLVSEPDNDYTTSDINNPN